jgi:hypothetical protein
VLVSDPYAFVAVRLTVYHPASVYVWTGFCSVEVVPSPKSHNHELGLPRDESVNVTVNGAISEVGEAEKFAATIKPGGGVVSITKLKKPSAALSVLNTNRDSVFSPFVFALQGFAAPVKVTVIFSPTAVRPPVDVNDR